MKTLLISCFVLLTNLSTHAKIKIPVCFPCEQIVTVKPLPDTATFVGENKEPLSIGYMYNEYGLLWVPFWNSKGEYVLTNKEQNTYYDLTEAELQEMKNSYQIDLDASPISLWGKLGGKIITLLIIAFIVWWKMTSSADDDDTEEKTS